MRSWETVKKHRTAICVGKMRVQLTSLFKAALAEARSPGSIAKRVSIKGREEGGKSLKVSVVQRL